MEILKTILITIVALEHFYFMILEMFLWNSPKGIKAFGLKSKEFADDTKVLAANQGLYNGFIATGLIYALISEQKQFIIFFLICVIIAGIYGAYSTKKLKLFHIQSVPALLSLITFLI